MSYPVLCTADFGEHNDGLTVHGKLFDATGAQTGSTVTSGIVEALDGLHIYTLSAPDGHVGVFVLYDSANTALRRTVVVAPRETENSDVLTSSRLADEDYAEPPTVEEIDTQLSGEHGAGSWEDAGGGGATAEEVWEYADRTLTALGSSAGVVYTYTVTDSETTNPIPDVSVWFSTNSAISNAIWYGGTDAFGVARDANGNKPRLDPGTYYVLCRKTGYTFTIDTEIVS